MNEQIKAIRNEIERRYAIYKAVSKPGIEDINTTAMRELEEILSFIDSQMVGTLQFDEAYLNECIAKARKMWKGVDVDKYMDEVRGRETFSDDSGKREKSKSTLDEEDEKMFKKISYTLRFAGNTFYKKNINEMINWLRSFINRPKLSDSLEEAAEECINEALFKWSYDDEDGIEQYVHDAFIAGAQWQKEQGYTKETTVYANRWTDVDEVTVSLGRGEYGFKAMDKVIVQIRKK